MTRRLLQEVSASTSNVDNLKDIMLGPPSQRYQARGNNTVTPLNCPSVSTPEDATSFPETPGIVSASHGNKQKLSH